MKEIKLEGLTHSYGVKQLFNQIDFSITDGQKIGLIGVNGTGKTTFLNILAGIEKADEGSISKPGNYAIGYLRQKNTLDLEQTVLETIFTGEGPVMRTVRSYEIVLKQLTDDPLNESIQKRFTQAEQEMNAKDAWNASTNAKTILNRLGIEEVHKQIKELSGGQQKRVALAQVLIQETDLLILDEPTNHLDFDMIKWLEKYLLNYKGALLLVTHDRYFLSNVVNQITELTHGSLVNYTGNYRDYIEQKAERETSQAQAKHKQKQLYKKELAWMREGVRARGTKQQARINRFDQLKEDVKQSQSQSSIDMNLAGSRLGKKVIELEDANFVRNQQILLDHFNLLIQKQDRIGITGKNGSGKTTFLNILSGLEQLDSGSLIIGETVKLAYYKQTNEQLDPDKRVINFLREIAEEIHLADGTRVNVSQLLEQFLFERSMHGSKIGSLSGGEKRRLYLMKLLMEQPNVLLLDEPTNDLDIETLSVLERYIDDFSGVVIAVSHDRYFLDKMSDKLLVFQGEGKVEEFFGTMTEYLEQLEAEEKQQVESKVKKSPASPKTPAKTKEKTRFTYMEKKEWDTIEEEIESLEINLETIDEEMIEAGSDYGKIEELNRRKSETEFRLEEKMKRWEYLSEYAE